MKDVRKSFAIPLAVLLVVVLALPVIVTAQNRGRGGGRGGGNRGAQAPIRSASPTPTPTRTTPPTTSPVQQVVLITKKDNTNVRGTIVSADVDRIVVQPALRAGENEMPAKVTLEWSDILRISNGLTKQKLLDEWKLQHLDELCDTCHGNRLVYCMTCKGTGHNPMLLLAIDCKTCNGELLLECKTPKCDDGKIPCTNTCLKLSEGQWIKKEDGLRWRRFPLANGGFVEFSEHHLGELIAHEGNQWVSKGKCPTCGGKSVIDDPICHGLGKIPCPTCVARKDVGDCPNHCDNGMVVCATCKGTGLKPSGQASPAPTALLEKNGGELLRDIELDHEYAIVR